MPTSPSSPETRKNRTPDVGALGENLVAHWLQVTGWEILHQRWRCRWGELDIIARQDPALKARGKGQQAIGNKEQENSCHSPLLVFVEVKTRSRGSWDAGGLLAITRQKQAKLFQAAQLFLAEYPDLAELPCRFDVALVEIKAIASLRPTPKRHRSDEAAIATSSCDTLPTELWLGQPVQLGQSQLTLHKYIQAAFDHPGG